MKQAVYIDNEDIPKIVMEYFDATENAQHILAEYFGVSDSNVIACENGYTVIGINE